MGCASIRWSLTIVAFSARYTYEILKIEQFMFCALLWTFPACLHVPLTPDKFLIACANFIFGLIKIRFLKEVEFALCAMNNPVSL